MAAYCSNKQWRKTLRISSISKIFAFSFEHKSSLSGQPGVKSHMVEMKKMFMWNKSSHSTCFVWHVSYGWQQHGTCGKRIGTRAKRPGVDPGGHYMDVSSWAVPQPPTVLTVPSKQRGSLTLRGWSLRVLKFGFTLLDNVSLWWILMDSTQPRNPRTKSVTTVTKRARPQVPLLKTGHPLGATWGKSRRWDWTTEQREGVRHAVTADKFQGLVKKQLECMSLGNFSVKGQMANPVSFMGHTVSVATTQSCHC